MGHLDAATVLDFTVEGGHRDVVEQYSTTRTVQKYRKSTWADSTTLIRVALRLFIDSVRPSTNHCQGKTGCSLV